MNHLTKASFVRIKTLLGILPVEHCANHNKKYSLHTHGRPRHIQICYLYIMFPMYSFITLSKFTILKKWLSVDVKSSGNRIQNRVQLLSFVHPETDVWEVGRRFCPHCHHQTVKIRKAKLNRRTHTYTHAMHAKTNELIGWAILPSRLLCNVTV